VKKKVAKKPRPVKRYIQRKDSLGRKYTIDRKTGKRVRNELAKAKKRKAPKREFKRVRELERKVSKLATELEQRATELKQTTTELEETRAREHERAEREAIEAEEAEFVPVETIPGFMQLTAVRAEKYPKIGMALDHAVGFAATEFLGIQRRIAEGYEPTEEELLRARLMTSHLGEDERYDNLDDAAHGLAEEYGLEVREVYTLFFSPEIA